MRIISLLGAVPVLAVSAASFGADLPCSVHPTKGMAHSQLEGLAKLSQPEAEKVALAQVKSKAAVSVTSGELEAEHGCLVWSFDLKVAGKSGVQEIQVDAGNGKVLSVKHETQRQEAAEARKEAAETAK